MTAANALALALGLTASFVSGASQSMPLCAFWMRSIHQPTAASTVLLCYVCWLVSSWEPLPVRRYQRLDSSLGRSVWRLSRSTSSRMPPSRHVLAYFRRMFRVRSLSALAQPNLQALVRQPADNVGARFDHFARGFRRRLNGRPSSLRCLSRPFSCHREASSQGSPGILRHLQMTAADFHYDRYSVFERWKRRVNIADLPQSIRPVLLRLVGLRTLRPKLPTIPRDSLRMAAEARLATCHQCTK